MDKHFPPAGKDLRIDSPGAGSTDRIAVMRPEAKPESVTPKAEPGPPQQFLKPRASDFWALVGCNAIVFSASVCIMVVELTASRLIANYVGSSLYTWTSVIGVVLAGISLGNYLGGWLADRYPPQKLLAWLFLASGLLTFSILIVNNMAAAAERPEWINWQFWVMLVVAWVFFLPALALGTISPVTASMALKRSAKTGVTVGNIYACGALGSIFGTFLTGFWLIGEFGSRQVIWMTSGVLVILAGLVAGGQRVFRAVALLGFLQLIVHYGVFSSATGPQVAKLASTIAGARSGWQTTPARFHDDEKAISAAEKKNDKRALLAARARNEWRQERKQAEDAWAEWGARLGTHMHAFGLSLGLRRDDPRQYNDESDYFTINIADLPSETGVVKVLTLDHLAHSFYDERNPTKLHYEYEQIYAAVTERAASQWKRKTAVELTRVPDDAFLDELPATVRYDRAGKTLAVQGPMDAGQLRQMLSIGPYAPFWQALLSAWEQGNGDWSSAAQRIGNVIAVPLPRLPKGVVFPAHLTARVHYDRVLKSIVCAGPFTFKELLELLSQGEFREYVEAAWELYNRSRQTSTLFIGGGGYIFPRWIEAAFPHQPRIDVAEIDPAVKLAAEKQLGLPAEYGPPADGKTCIRTYAGDARRFVDDQERANKRRVAAGEQPVAYDFVYGDAFNDVSVPWHLTTLEYSTKISQLLTPREGVYLVNLMDIYPRVQYPDGTVKSGNANSRPAMSVRLPPALMPADPVDEEWQPAPAPFESLHVFHLRDGGYRLGIRGVMPDEMRKALLEVAGKDEKLKDAVQVLCRRSRQEKFGRFLGRFVNTVKQVFPFVYVFTSNKDQPGETRDTFVVVCALKKLDFSNLERNGGYWRNGPFAWCVTDRTGERRPFGEMPSILQLARGELLTDDFAPVDNLLAPVPLSRDKTAAE
jgi:hypothetical protein